METSLLESLSMHCLEGARWDETPWIAEQRRQVEEGRATDSYGSHEIIDVNTATLDKFWNTEEAFVRLLSHREFPIRENTARELHGNDGQRGKGRYRSKRTTALR